MSHFIPSFFIYTVVGDTHDSAGANTTDSYTGAVTPTTQINNFVTTPTISSEQVLKTISVTQTSATKAVAVYAWVQHDDTGAAGTTTYRIRRGSTTAGAEIVSYASTTVPEIFILSAVDTSPAGSTSDYVFTAISNSGPKQIRAYFSFCEISLSGSAGTCQVA